MPSVAGQLVEVERGDAEHGPGPFAVAGGDDRRVDVEKAVFLKEIVDAAADAVADARDRAEGVGPRAQVGPFAELFERVLLLLQRIGFGIGRAEDGQLFGEDFGGLAFAAGGLHFAFDGDAAAGGEVLDFGFVVGQRSRRR